MEKSEMSEEIRIPLSEATDNAHAIVVATELAGQAGFDKVDQCMIATAVSELATNILRYAEKGVIQLTIIQCDNRTGMEIIAEDEGPGIENVPQAMEENSSTGNSLGLGLPSVKRIMDEFNIDSEPGQGTRILARKWR
jgi:serine/threonine-protein kinase RsbT